MTWIGTPPGRSPEPATSYADDVIRAAASWSIGIEVVNPRWSSYEFTWLDNTADNSSAAAIAIGDRVPFAGSLAEVGVRPLTQTQPRVPTLFSSANAWVRRVTNDSSPARSHTRGSYFFLLGWSGPSGLPIWPCR